MVHHIHETAFRQNISRQEQFGIVSDMAETLVYDGCGMTESYNQQGKLFVGLAVIVHQSVPQLPCALVHRGCAPLPGFAHQEGNTAVLALILQDRGYDVVFHHNADGNEAVEPRVGSFFLHHLYSLLADGLLQRYPLVIEVGAYHLSHEGGSALEQLRFFGGGAFIREAQRRKTLLHALYQYIACLCGKTL